MFVMVIWFLTFAGGTPAVPAILLSLFWLFADSTGIPPGWADIITLVIGVALTIVLKMSPIPSRVVNALGVLAGLFGVIGPRIVDLFPAGSHVGLILAAIGFVVASISERIQGGVTVPEKRELAKQGEM